MIIYINSYKKKFSQKFHQEHFSIFQKDPPFFILLNFLEQSEHYFTKSTRITYLFLKKIYIYILA